jgi:hypothetical protein
MVHPALLPRWVYDLLNAIKKYEYEHAKGAPCIAAALEHVPEYELDRADVIAHYGAQIPQE